MNWNLDFKSDLITQKMKSGAKREYLKDFEKFGVFTLTHFMGTGDDYVHHRR